jgi:chemotaxis response regulator CheB
VAKQQAKKTGGTTKKPVTTKKTKPQPKSGNNPFHVVGIGASSAGINSITALLSALPADLGMAYVIVQNASNLQQSISAAIITVAYINDGNRSEAGNDDHP